VRADATPSTGIPRTARRQRSPVTQRSWVLLLIACAGTSVSLGLGAEVEGPPNERMQLTKSTPRLTAEGVAFAADPRCWTGFNVKDRGAT